MRRTITWNRDKDNLLCLIWATQFCAYFQCKPWTSAGFFSFYKSANESIKTATRGTKARFFYQQRLLLQVQLVYYRAMSQHLKTHSKSHKNKTVKSISGEKPTDPTSTRAGPLVFRVKTLVPLLVWNIWVTPVTRYKIRVVTFWFTGLK